MSNSRTWLSYTRIRLFAIYILCSCMVGYFFGDALRVSEKPNEYIATLFSILSATIFAVVSIIGDPSMLIPGGKRVAHENALAIQTRLQRLNVIYIFQISTIILLIISEVIEAMKWEDFYFMFNILGGIATFAFFLSIGLPFELASIQRSRLKNEVARRPKDAI